MSIRPCLLHIAVERLKRENRLGLGEKCCQIGWVVGCCHALMSYWDFLCYDGVRVDFCAHGFLTFALCNFVSSVFSF